MYAEEFVLRNTNKRIVILTEAKLRVHCQCMLRGVLLHRVFFAACGQLSNLRAFPGKSFMVAFMVFCLCLQENLVVVLV